MVHYSCKLHLVVSDGRHRVRKNSRCHRGVVFFMVVNTCSRNRQRVEGSRRDLMNRGLSAQIRGPYITKNSPRLEQRLKNGLTSLYDDKESFIYSKISYKYGASLAGKFLERSVETLKIQAVGAEEYSAKVVEWYKKTHSIAGELRTMQIGRYLHLNSIPRNVVTREQYEAVLESTKDAVIIDQNDLWLNNKNTRRHRAVDMFKAVSRFGGFPWRIVDTYKSRSLVITIDADGAAYGITYIAGQDSSADYGSLTGSEAYQILDAICIKTTKYKLETQVKHHLKSNNIIVKDLPTPKVRIESIARFRDKEFNNVVSYDRNRAFGYGVCVRIPAIKPAIDFIEDKLKELPSDSEERNFWKSIINMAVGYCGIKDAEGKYSKDLGILDYYARMENLEFTDNLDKLCRECGVIPLNYATDCVRVIGGEEELNELYEKIDSVYGINNELGGVKVDYYSRFRMKADGAYEYVKNGIYKCAYRGKKKPDNIEWGWLYNEEESAKKFKFDADGSIIEVAEKESIL